MANNYKWKQSSDFQNWHPTGRKPDISWRMNTSVHIVCIILAQIDNVFIRRTFTWVELQCLDKPHAKTRLLIIDTRVSNLGMDVVNDMIDALENVLAVICHMAGPSKMPLFGLYGLDNKSQMLLPLTHLKGNLSRIQTSLHNLRTLMDAATSQTLSGCLEFGIKEAYNQFRRQVHQNSRGILESCQQLEIILLTTQPKDVVQRQIDIAANTLESQHLTKIQVKIIGEGIDDDCYGGRDDVSSQGSSVASSDNPLSGIVEISTLDASLSFQKFFSEWLLDHNTDSERLHLVIPSCKDGDDEIVIKCDLQERLINPSDLPFRDEYIVHQDTIGVKQFTSSSKATESKQRIIRLVARKLLLNSSICESLVFGMPMVVQPTTCWRMDWDELERHQHSFRSLCIQLIEKGLAILMQLDVVYDDTDLKASCRSAGFKQQIDKKPRGYFLLLPSLNGTMLLKSIAAGELILPCKPAINTLDPCSSLSMERISKAISSMEISDACNPFDWISGLFEGLKAKGCPATQKATKRKSNSLFNPPSVSDF